MPAGMGRVEVRFQVDADGILSVAAKEQASGVSQQITVKPSHGLTDEEIEQMLLDSIEHAEEDVRQRLLREQQVEAQRVLADAGKQLAANGDLVKPDERALIDAAMAKVAGLAKSATDFQELEAAIRALDELSKPFIERVMNRAIAQAVAGHSVEEF